MADDPKLAALTAEIDHLRKKISQLEAASSAAAAVEARLEQSEKRFAGILDIANEAIISVDEAQKIVLFNQGAERIFGYQASEVLNQPLDMLLPPDMVAVHQHYLQEFATVPQQSRYMNDRNDIKGRRKNGQVFPASGSISKLSLNEGSVFTVVLRDITARKAAEAERERIITELKTLNESIQTITAEMSLEPVLRRVAYTARVLVKSGYAALGLYDGNKQLAQFLTAGLTPSQKAMTETYVIGQSLLNLMLAQGQSLILNELTPPPPGLDVRLAQPKMESLLGVPIFSQSKLIGALYLINKLDGSAFNQTDQQLVETLALHAANAIENARLYEQSERLAVLEERERFARDLHDGIIQSIYGVGLTLDIVSSSLPVSAKDSARKIEFAVSNLATVIQDLRNYIFDLRPQALSQTGVVKRLKGLLTELKGNTNLRLNTTIDPEVEAYLSEMEERHLFHIAHEALSNAARHANATEVSLLLTHQQGEIMLEVQDNGVGFNPPQEIIPGHRGLANIRSRAKQIGGQLHLISQPGAGTRLQLLLQRPK